MLYDGVFFAGEYAIVVSAETASCRLSFGYWNCDRSALHGTANDVEDCILGILTSFIPNFRGLMPST